MVPQPSMDHPSTMAWPQRQRFRDLVREYRQAQGMTPEEFAPLIGLKPTGLHGLLYDKRAEPSLEVIQRAAEVLGVSIGELVDDPGAQLPGVEGSASELTAAKRVVMNAVFQNLKGADVSDEQALAYLRILQAAVESNRIRPLK